MKNTLMRAHAAQVNNPILTWAEWLKLWFSTTDEYQLLNLLHIGFSVKMPAKKNKYDTDIDTPEHISYRYRLYLHIADVSSGYSLQIRQKAFITLFGGSNMHLHGVFPRKKNAVRSELNTLFWFMRPKSNSKGAYRNFVNIQLLESVRSSAQTKFWDGLLKCAHDIWRTGYLYFEFSFRQILAVESGRQRLLMLRILLNKTDHSFLMGSIMEGIRREHTGKLEGCITLENLQVIEERIAWFTPEARAMIQDIIQNKSFPHRAPLFPEFPPADRYAESFINNLEKLAKEIIPTARAWTMGVME